MVDNILVYLLAALLIAGFVFICKNAIDRNENGREYVNSIDENKVEEEIEKEEN